MLIKSVAFRSLIFLATLSACWSNSAAQGGAAVITLVMPPPGGDGYNALQSGGAFAMGATSLYYNPALLPNLQRSTGSSLHFSHSQQDLLPGSQNTTQNFNAFSAVLPSENGYDVGLGFFRNRINFGESLSPLDGSLFNSRETVYGLGAAIRLGLPVSVGGTVKYYDSKIGPVGRDSAGQRFDGQATGFAFDVGVAVNPLIRPLSKQGNQALELRPAVAAAWQNLGPDVWYVTPSQSDPLPQALRMSFGLETRFADVASVSLGYDGEARTFSRTGFSDWNESPVRTYGFMLDVAGFQFSRGRLEDPDGGRSEGHQAIAYEFNLVRLHRIQKRILTQDFQSASESLDEGFLFGETNVLGLSYRMNPRFLIGKRSIEEGSRKGQEAWYFSLSL